MTDPEGWAPRKRIDLPSQFSHPVVVEAVTVHGDTALVRVKRPDGGLDDVTLDVAELDQALDRATPHAAPSASPSSGNARRTPPAPPGPTTNRRPSSP